MLNDEVFSMATHRFCRVASITASLGVAAVIMLFGGQADALSLTLDNDGTPSFQQQQNSPCVIGGPSCNNVAGFGFTDINALDDDGTVTAAEGTSPTYTVGQITALVGNSFLIGIDTNQSAGGANPGINLLSFTVLVAGSPAFTFTGVPGGTEINLINGNGFSDATLNGIDLSGFATNASVQFIANYTDATAGAESFFLASASAPPSVPEPSSLLLLGTGILGVAFTARRLLRA
jgi:PEP-CTERM motif